MVRDEYLDFVLNRTSVPSTVYSVFNTISLILLFTHTHTQNYYYYYYYYCFNLVQNARNYDYSWNKKA